MAGGGGFGGRSAVVVPLVGCLSGSAQEPGPFRGWWRRRVGTGVPAAAGAGALAAAENKDLRAFAPGVVKLISAIDGVP
jgi:hypothetical protein